MYVYRLSQIRDLLTMRRVHRAVWRQACMGGVQWRTSHFRSRASASWHFWRYSPLPRKARLCKCLRTRNLDAFVSGRSVLLAGRSLSFLVGFGSFGRSQVLLWPKHITCSLRTPSSGIPVSTDVAWIVHQSAQSDYRTTTCVAS